MKDNRKTEYLQSLRKGGHSTSATFTRIHSASNSGSVRAFNVKVTKKEQVLANFTEQYLEDLLIQNCSSTNVMAELSQIFVPKQSLEPYRNVKNFGILMDLVKIFGQNEF